VRGFGCVYMTSNVASLDKKRTHHTPHSATFKSAPTRENNTCLTNRTGQATSRVPTGARLSRFDSGIPDTRGPVRCRMGRRSHARIKLENGGDRVITKVNTDFFSQPYVSLSMPHIPTTNKSTKGEASHQTCTQIPSRHPLCPRLQTSLRGYNPERAQVRPIFIGFPFSGSSRNHASNISPLPSSLAH